MQVKPTEAKRIEPRLDAGVELAVVIPVYNEAAVIEQLILDLEGSLVALVESLQVIIVDDASTDQTPQTLARLTSSRPWLRVERATENLGHGPSVLRGLELAEGDWIFQLDSDGQVDVTEFRHLWEQRHGHDLVLGVRSHRRDPFHRRALSSVISVAVSALCRHRLRDVNTPVRVLRRELADDLLRVIAPGTLAPNLFVVVGAATRGWDICEIPITHLPRMYGRSSLRAGRLVLFSVRGLVELLSFRYRLSRTPHRTRIAANALT
jgi:glycosyltransferase involved in cell wall biosynthesis